MSNSVLAVLAILLLLEMILAAPYGGWGPGEGFGHSGARPPQKNINAIYGYDYHDIFDDHSTYGAVYNPHKKRKNLFNRKKRKLHSNSFPVVKPDSKELEHVPSFDESTLRKREKAFQDFYRRLETFFTFKTI